MSPPLSLAQAVGNVDLAVFRQVFENPVTSHFPKIQAHTRRGTHSVSTEKDATLLVTGIGGLDRVPGGELPKSHVAVVIDAPQNKQHRPGPAFRNKGRTVGGKSTCTDGIKVGVLH